MSFKIEVQEPIVRKAIASAVVAVRDQNPDLTNKAVVEKVAHMFAVLVPIVHECMKENGVSF